ncbi:hypothetical protein ACSBR1_012746 [Camellia fascicularis]
MTATSSLRLLWLPLPFASCLSDSSNLFHTSNPSPFSNKSSFPSSSSFSSSTSSSSSSSSSYSHRRCVGRSRFFRSLSNLSSTRQTELLAIQQQGPRAIGFFGTRNMGFMHQELIEILSYAMVITKNHIFTSGASGTNAAVIRGALRAEKPELLTVILPQSLKKQPPESQELLAKVKNVIEKPHNDHLPLIEASRLCNMDIISHVQQVICFAFHDSKLLMDTCQEAKNLRKIVTLFYLD